MSWIEISNRWCRRGAIFPTLKAAQAACLKLGSSACPGIYDLRLTLAIGLNPTVALALTLNLTLALALALTLTLALTLLHLPSSYAPIAATHSMLPTEILTACIHRLCMRTYITIMSDFAGPDNRWRVGKRCSFQPQTKKQLKSVCN